MQHKKDAYSKFPEEIVKEIESLSPSTGWIVKELVSQIDMLDEYTPENDVGEYLKTLNKRNAILKQLSDIFLKAKDVQLRASGSSSDQSDSIEILRDTLLDLDIGPLEVDKIIAAFGNRLFSQ